MILTNCLYGVEPLTKIVLSLTITGKRETNIFLGFEVRKNGFGCAFGGVGFHFLIQVTELNSKHARRERFLLWCLRY